MLDDRNAAAEAAKCLCQLKADIAAAEHDQMVRHIVELQRLDVRDRSGRIEARHIRNCRVGSDVEKNLIARQNAAPPSFNRTSSVFGATNVPAPRINSAPLSLYCCKVAAISLRPCRACADGLSPCQSRRGLFSRRS